jgi:alkaline phosphatase D
MQTKTLIYVALLALAACSTQKENSNEAGSASETVSNREAETLQRVDQPYDEVLTTIAFGSCNRQDEPQPLWAEITKHDPQLWIWLGDNIYGDTQDMQVMQAKYNRQLELSNYREFLQEVPVIGVWDDHDYGANDAGKDYPQKDASKELMMEFLAVSDNSNQLGHKGAYGSYVYGPEGKQVKVILLDTRYFRDDLEREDGVYLPNEEGTMLGEEQWTWLEGELANSTADVNIIGSSIQVLSSEHRFEKWQNFPAERERLINLVANSGVKNAFFLSGDRHVAEISRMEAEGVSYPLYDITSSGLTHVYAGADASKEPNRYRQSDLIGKLNYGLIQINWEEEQPEVSVSIKGLNDATYASTELK